METTETYPYIINLKNTTDEKLYNVSVFNFDFDKQDKVKHNINLNHLTYAQFLNCLNYPYGSFEIGSIKLVSFHDNKIYQQEQVDNFKISYKEIYIDEKDNNEAYFVHPLFFMLDKSTDIKNQAQLELTKGIQVLFNKNHKMDLILDFLLPDMNLSIILFPNKRKITNNG